MTSGGAGSDRREGTPELGTDAEASGMQEELAILRCDLCGGGMLDRHCKLTCLLCGYQRDCSDP